MPLPSGVKIGVGSRIPTSQRGYFVHFPDGSIHYTACRFASLAQSLARTGIVGSLDRKKPAAGAPDNLVHQLQVAGDNTPKNGSTLGQAQKALRALFGADAPPIQFGTMSDAEVQDALAKGATIGIGMDCAKWPAYLKRFVGQHYNGGHFCAFDDVRVNATTHELEVAMTDHMFAPAKSIKSKWIPWADVAPSMSRRNGDVIVTLGYDSAATAKPVDQVAQLQAQLATYRDQAAAAIAAKGAAEARATSAEAALGVANARIAAAQDALTGDQEIENPVQD